MKKIILTALFMGILLGGHARNTASPFQAVVAQDGSGDYTSIQAVRKSCERCDNSRRLNMATRPAVSCRSMNSCG